MQTFELWLETHHDFNLDEIWKPNWKHAAFLGSAVGLGVSGNHQLHKTPVPIVKNIGANSPAHIALSRQNDQSSEFKSYVDFNPETYEDLKSEVDDLFKNAIKNPKLLNKARSAIMQENQFLRTLLDREHQLDLEGFKVNPKQRLGQLADYWQKLNNEQDWNNPPSF